MCTLEGACVTEKGFGSDGCDGEGAGVPRVGCHGEVWGGEGGERGGSNTSRVRVDGCDRSVTGVHGGWDGLCVCVCAARGG